MSVCFWFLSFPQNGPSWSPFKHSSQKPIIQAFYYASLFHLVWHLLGEIFKVSLPSVIFKMKVIFANSTDWFECCVCFSSSVHLILMGLLGPYLVLIIKTCHDGTLANLIKVCLMVSHSMTGHSIYSVVVWSFLNFHLELMFWKQNYMKTSF